jgi:hypothetical protein
MTALPEAVAALIAEHLPWQMPSWRPESAWYMHAPFAQACIGLLRPRTLVELGTQKGLSYCAFLEAAARLGHPMQAWAVDHWGGDEHTGAYDPDTYDSLRAYHDPRYGGHSTLLRMGFDEAAGRFEPGSLDLIHIDGLHTYEAVRHDLETWRPLASVRAVVLFHDTEVRSGDFGVWRLWQELEASHPTLHFPFCHGLGVAALGPEVPRAFLDLCRLDGAARAGLYRLFEALGDRVRLQAATDALAAERQSLRFQMDHLQAVRAGEVQALTDQMVHLDQVRKGEMRLLQDQIDALWPALEEARRAAPAAS